MNGSPYQHGERKLTWLALGAVVVCLLGWSVGVLAGQRESFLVRSVWKDDSEVTIFEQMGGTLRYCHSDWAIFEIAQESLGDLDGVDTPFAVLDTVRTGRRHWLVRVPDSSSRDSLALYGKLCPLDGENLFLLGVEETLETFLAPLVSSMRLLPERAGRRGALLGRRPAELAWRAGVGDVLTEERARLLASVSSKVSLDSIAAIVHFVSVDDSSGELRSRFTLRDETVHMAHALRERLNAAMGVHGIDSLHVFIFRYGGINYTLYNVVGRLPGQVAGSGTFVLCAHYDAYAGRTVYEDPDRRWIWITDPAPGADDNGSGIASVLECARVLSELEFDFDIEFVLFCAEEQGLFGSRAYAQEHEALGSNILGVLNFDMHAFRETAETTFVRTNSSSEWLSNHIDRISEQLYDTIGLRVALTPVDELYDCSDHSSFWYSGFDAVHFFEHSNLDIPNPYYHSIYDTEDKLNFELSWKVAKLAAASMAYFATTSDPWDLEVLAGDLDFSVEGSSSPATQATVGQVVRVTPSFHNVGGRAPDTLSVEVSVFDGNPSTGGRLIGQRLLSGAVASGGSIPLEAFDWLLREDDVGVRSIYLVVDAGDGEQNRENNVSSSAFGVYSTSLTITQSFVFPNPSRGPQGEARLSFCLARDAEEVQLDIYDISGRRVGGCRGASCGGEAYPPRLGPNEIAVGEILREKHIASGVYMYRLQVDGGEESRVMVGRFAVLR